MESGSSFFIVQTIKVWDLESGSSIFEYGGAHGDTAITCLTFDSTYKRSAALRIWYACYFNKIGHLAHYAYGTFYYRL